jgi:hypothetical protein
MMMPTQSTAQMVFDGGVREQGENEEEEGKVGFEVNP